MQHQEQEAPPTEPTQVADDKVTILPVVLLVVTQEQYAEMVAEHDNEAN